MTASGLPTAAAAAAVADESAPLEWGAFCERYFPGRPRHDREAILAYGVYRRDHAPGASFVASGE